ncbi:hypothetical protein FJY84_03840 [Candidatus Bathyarchaeota archaeon]|nr:hypothetical protein [Candidatus Bathyarchaeota archaeon]
MKDDKSKKTRSLRFDKQILFVNEIAGQYFCEKKLEMQHIHGRVETDLKTMGAEAHEMLIDDSEKVSQEELFLEIQKKKQVIAYEMKLLGEYRNITLFGRPDCVFFDKGIPKTVLEFKFSNYKKPFNDFHIQVGAYCLLLGKMGFKINELYYGIVMVNPSVKDKKNLINSILDYTSKNNFIDPIVDFGNARMYFCKYNSESILNELNWAIDYWTRQREAIPTTNQKKCMSCEYNKKCENSLITI